MIPSLFLSSSLLNHIAPAHAPTPPGAQAIREDIFEVGQEGMTVQELAAMLAVQPTEIVKFLFMKVGFAFVG